MSEKQKTSSIAVTLLLATSSFSFTIRRKPEGSLDTPVTVICDGITRQTEAGGSIVLKAGESITLPPGLYHSFYSVNGSALIGEVSSRNDDATDNRFYQSLARFPEILEDEPPFRLLITEYPKLSDSADPAGGTQNI